MENNKVDIKENYIYSLNDTILNILLKDRSSRKNIIWATDNYRDFGQGYQEDDYITIKSITGKNGEVIKPRIEKTKEEQINRIRNKAEVFTPSHVCNKQNNLIDNEWFGRQNIFNIETENGWFTVEEKVKFTSDKGKTWQDYIKANRLEVSCGEAPYLTSRYDTVSGSEIPVKERIGLLDRKLRVVSENVDSEPDWYKWAKRAVQSVYGYDWQGDNVLLARENLLFTFAEFYEEKFGVPAIKEYLKEIARIVSWNIWQMDGLKFVIPNSCKEERISSLTMFGNEEITIAKCSGCEKNDNSCHNGIYCRIYDWPSNRSVEFYSQMNKRRVK